MITEKNIACKHNDNELANCVIRPSDHTSPNPLNTCVGVGNKCVVPIELDTNQNVINKANHTVTIIVFEELLSS